LDATSLWTVGLQIEYAYVGSEFQGVERLHLLPTFLCKVPVRLKGMVKLVLQAEASGLESWPVLEDCSDAGSCVLPQPSDLDWRHFFPIFPSCQVEDTFPLVIHGSG
jgi:hypothetical protein